VSSYQFSSISSNRPIKVTDRKGQATTMTYTPRSQIESISSADRTVNYSYDAIGRVTEIRDASSVNAYQYDNADRLTQVDSSTAAGSHRLHYGYDSLDRVTQRTLSGSGIQTPEVTTYSWDIAGRLLGHVTRIGSSTTSDSSHSTKYDYDSAGRLSARKVQAGNPTSPGSERITQRYGYDSLERLAQIKYIKAEGTTGEQLIEQIDYGYDTLGRRTSKTTLNNNGTGQGETPMQASYDSANRMGSITLTIGTATKTYSLSYDAAGNLTSKQNSQDANDKTTYTWDASNRLSQISQTAAGSTATGTSSTTAISILNASFTYDAFGRRIQSSISQGSNPVQTVQYLYEGAQALGEIRNGQLTHRLLTGLNLDETIARIALNANGQKDAANSRIYLTDALNSVIAQLSDDNNANIQNSYAYSPYGESTTVGPDNTNNPNQYASRENDGTGLYFYRARYYDPVLKRFISSDPIGLDGGLNTFGYVDNSPAEYSDPEGELPIIPLAIAYGRCVASCMAQSAVSEAIFGDIKCFDVGDNAKSCALDCLNPFNWGGKNLASRAKDIRKKPGSLGKSKGTDALRRENKVANDAAKEAGLTKDQQNILHNEISGQGLTYQQILDIARQIKNGIY
jgi:RHS repeat-associated protein